MKSVRFGNKKFLAVLIIFSLVGAGATGLLAVFLGDIVDLGQKGDLSGMLALIPLFGVIAGVVFLNGLLQLQVKTSYIKHSMILMKDTFLRKLMKKDITQLQKEFTPIYRSQLTQDMDRYENKFFEQVVVALTMSCNALVSLVILFSVSVQLGIAAGVLIAVFALISSKSGKPLQKSETKKTESLNAYTSFIEESLEGFEVIKQHQLEAVRKADFDKVAKKVQYDNYLLDIKVTNVDSLNTLLQMLVIYTVVVGGLLFANQSSASLGDVIKVIMAFSNVLWPMQQMVPTITQMVSIQDVIRTFDEQLDSVVKARPLSIGKYESFEFDGTDLGYDSVILSDVSLDIGKQDKVLIVGPSGAGKSTILKTMRQSIMPHDGEVLMNGCNIYDIEVMSYYQNFATVDQVGYIFNGTLKENLTLHQEVNERVLHNALESVCMDDLDLDTVLINNGANLSGGQRARLLAARALCLGASIIICDEIFAALDAKVAQEIEHDLLKLDQAIVNVSHIFFEENLNQYDAIYKVDDGCVTRVYEPQVLIDGMLKAT